MEQNPINSIGSQALSTRKNTKRAREREREGNQEKLASNSTKIDAQNQAAENAHKAKGRIKMK